jgi:hypothetical protein
VRSIRIGRIERRDGHPEKGTNIFILAALPDSEDVGDGTAAVPDARILSVEVQRKAMDQDHVAGQ